jgi:hypothetical protein
MPDAGPSGREIEQALRDKLDRLVPELLTGAMRDGAFWCAGSVAGEAGQSLKVNRAGARRGCWTDFSAAEGTDEYAGDMLKLICVVHFGGWSRGNEARGKAIQWAKGWLGWEQIDPDRLQKVRREADARAAAADKAAVIEAEGKRESAWAMWSGAVAIAGTPAEAYLRGRGIDFERLGRIPGSLRFMPDCWCSIRSRATRQKYPAMVAAVYRGSEFAAVHRTFLDVSAGKGGPVSAVKVVRDDATKQVPDRDRRRPGGGPAPQIAQADAGRIFGRVHRPPQGRAKRVAGGDAAGHAALRQRRDRGRTERRGRGSVADRRRRGRARQHGRAGAAGAGRAGHLHRAERPDRQQSGRGVRAGGRAPAAGGA